MAGWNRQAIQKQECLLTALQYQFTDPHDMDCSVLNNVQTTRVNMVGTVIALYEVSIQRNNVSGIFLLMLNQ
jgi:hypothetical protein